MRLASVRRLGLRVLALAALSCMLAPGLHALPQAGQQSREQAKLAEEQVRMGRQIGRLKEIMGALADRFEREGRTNGAKLLREGLEHLTQRIEEANSMTLTELIDSSRQDIDSGSPHVALERQERIIASLEALLSILMDRKGLENIEDSLAELKEIKAALGDLADRESTLQEQTEALRAESSNDEQKALEQGIESALSEQRELLRQNEDMSRQSGLFDLEKIDAKLEALVAEQRTDSAILNEWDPADEANLEKLQPSLEAARAEEARAERLEQAAQDLRKAARETREAETQDQLNAIAKDLASAAEREERHERVSNDEAAAQASAALSESSEEINAAQSSEAQASAADQAEARAAELEQSAQAARQAAAAARDEAREEARALAQSDKPSGMTAERVLEALSDQDPTPENGTEQALRELNYGIQQQSRMGEAMAQSQAEKSQAASELAQELERVPQSATGAESESAAQAAEALARAAQAMQSAAESARGDNANPEDASAASQEAVAALEEAQAALAQAREETARAADAEQTAALTQAQAELANKMDELKQGSQEASLSSAAQSSVQESLSQAQQAMQQASEAMQSGERSEAASAQREAIDALQQAGEQSSQGVEPQTPEQQERAEELAAEQERIRQQLLELARRNEERESPLPQPNFSAASNAAREASESLEQGNLEQAQQQEAEAEREMRDALDELEEEEDTYQKLRQEELLFQIAEEVAAMLEIHREQMTATREVDSGRKDTGRASRSERFKLRNIAREEEGLAQRSNKIGQAILQEGSFVFGEILRSIESDLSRIARDMDSSGNYQSGGRIQSLQKDVENSMGWIQAALEDELERRQDEQQQGESEGGEQPEAEERLVPDVAELRMLRLLEGEMLQQMEQLIALHPELEDESAQHDPMLLEDISRLAYRHQRVSNLFAMFRERLKLPDPMQEDGTEVE